MSHKAMIVRVTSATICVAFFTWSNAAAQSSDDAIQPGTEVRIEAPQSRSFGLVYVPEDYTPDREWPVILCYPGAGGGATTWPFRQMTGGKGFVVIGMNYLRQEYGRT